MGIISNLVSSFNLYWLVFGIPTIIISSAVHEFAHAWTANKLGDHTAKMMGRLTLNPIAHIDPLGATMMILTRFGWSKPVPINPLNFTDPIVGMAVSAAAGPISNLLLVLLAGIPLKILYMTQHTDIADLLSIPLAPFIVINVALMAFNLIPIPPLDGYRIVAAVIPQGAKLAWVKMEHYAPLFLALIILPISPIGYIVSNGLGRIIEVMTGIFIPL